MILTALTTPSSATATLCRMICIGELIIDWWFIRWTLCYRIGNFVKVIVAIVNAFAVTISSEWSQPLCGNRRDSGECGRFVYNRKQQFNRLPDRIKTHVISYTFVGDEFLPNPDAAIV